MGLRPSDRRRDRVGPGDCAGGAGALRRDKTGTLTHGQASLSAIRAFGNFSEDDVLRPAAALDQASNHVVASALVAAARARGLALTPPVDVRETPGAAASSEAADAVLLVDRLDRIAEAMAIARRSRTIALQSVIAGIGLSVAAMVVAPSATCPRSRGRCCRKSFTLQ